MTTSTRDTVHEYFRRLSEGLDWQDMLSDGLAFASPTVTSSGRDSYIESTARFFANVRAVETRETLVDGDKACVLTRYGLESPAGKTMQCEVAEVFSVRAGKIASLSIFFDTAPFARFNAG